MKPVQIRMLTVQAITVLAVVLPLLAGAAWVWSKMEAAQTALDQMAPRHARLLGLQSAKESLLQLTQSAQVALADWVYPASDDATQTGNAVQDRIRAVLTDSKLDVGSIQLTPSVESGPFAQAGIVVKVEGDVVSLQTALASLEALRPRIVVDSMTMHVVGGVRPKQAVRLSIQLNMSFWRVS